MAKGTFGERLKRERELREVSLEEVGKGTRIAERFLQALENEQWDRLPAGVFGRGFVRSIARYLGLSEENLLAEYDLARGESGNPPSPRTEERIPSPPKWIPAVVALALAFVAVALLVGGRYAWKAYQAHRAQKKTSAVVRSPSPAEVPSPAPYAARWLPPATGTSLTLEITTHFTTPLRVLADDGVVFGGDFPPARRRRFSAEDGLEGTAARLPTLLLNLNGQNLLWRAPSGSSGTIVWTKTDLRQANGGDTER